MSEAPIADSRVCPKCGRVDALLHECDVKPVKPAPFAGRKSAWNTPQFDWPAWVEMNRKASRAV